MPPRRRSATVRAWPDAKVFDAAGLRAENSEAPAAQGRADAGPRRSEPRHRGAATPAWLFEHGMRGYLGEVLTDEPLIPLFLGENSPPGRRRTFAAGGAPRGRWRDGPGRRAGARILPRGFSSHPGRRRRHEAGLREASAIKELHRPPRCLPKGVKLTADDAFGRASFLLSARVMTPASGPDKGAPQQPRRGAIGVADGARPLRAVAQRARGLRQRSSPESWP